MLLFFIVFPLLFLFLLLLLLIFVHTVPWIHHPCRIHLMMIYYNSERIDSIRYSQDKGSHGYRWHSPAKALFKRKQTHMHALNSTPNLFRTEWMDITSTALATAAAETMRKKIQHHHISQIDCLWMFRWRFVCKKKQSGGQSSCTLTH